MHWRELNPASPALLVEVRRGELPSRPTFRPEWTPTRWRIVCGGEAQMWAIDDWYFDDWTTLVRARPRRLVLDPIRAETMRECRAAPGSLAWWQWWTKELVRQLFAATVTPLFPGEWVAFPLVSRGGQAFASSNDLQRMPRTFELPELAAGHEWYEPRAYSRVVPIRSWSAADDARVKMWRKRAREGTAPPVLALYLDALERSLILDGHDRLQAAVLEKTPACVVALAPLRREKVARDEANRERVLKNLAVAIGDPRKKHRFDPRSLNETLIELFREEQLRIVQRTWPLAGGRARWSREVRRELRAMGQEPDQSLILAPMMRDRR